METEIINRVANSSLRQVDLEDWYPKMEKAGFDLADFLFERLILKEMDFRNALKQFPWENLKDKLVAIYCSEDAIVPTWAYMLAANYASLQTGFVFFCKPEELDTFYYEKVIEGIQVSDYQDEKVIVKGCSKHPVPLSAFVSFAAKVSPVVQSLMFGEPCSSVPLYKKKKNLSPT
jgi:hypothetical protein